MQPDADDHQFFRSSAPIERTHQRFLLRELHFTQQFASMYAARINQLLRRAVQSALHHCDGAPPLFSRILDLNPNTRCVIAGTLFKHLPHYAGFLSEYQKELVRIDAGCADEDGDDAAINELPELTEKVVASTSSWCTAEDTVILEDDSGRVELSRLTVDVHGLVSGMVVAAVGHLREKGLFAVEKLYFAELPQQMPRRLSTTVVVSQSTASCSDTKYIAFVCGLSLDCRGTPTRPLALMLEFLEGLLGTEEVTAMAQRVTRLVIGGNTLAVTDEQRLKAKVRLEPSDHQQLSNTSNTAGSSMKYMDQLLAAMAEMVEVDVMPGDTDPSNAYLPQQPLHPLLLKQASRKGTLRLVTNPYEFNVPESGTEFFVSSGQPVDDILRQSRYTSVCEVCAVLLRCGCCCPTAPNTLVCYPFKGVDPFVFPSVPHCFVSCNAPQFETRFEQSIANGVRLVAVPSFSSSGLLVLVDVVSLETQCISFV